MVTLASIPYTGHSCETNTFIAFIPLSMSSESLVWTSFLEKVARYNVPLTDTAARALLISCATEQLSKVGPSTAIRIRRMVEFLGDSPAQPPAITVRLAPGLLRRLSFPKKCDSHSSTSAKRVQEIQAQAADDFNREQLLQASTALKEVLAPPVEDSGPVLDLSLFPSDDWEVEKETSTFLRMFEAVEFLQSQGPLVIFPANCDSFAAWQILKIALLIRVACAPLERPTFRFPPGMASLECRLLNLASPGEFDYEESAEWADSAREYLRQSPALQATRNSLKRARFYLYGRNPHEARLIAHQALEGDFKRFLYEELYPRMERRN